MQASTETADSLAKPGTPDPSPEELAVFQAVLRAWVDKLPNGVLAQPSLFWQRATRDLAPLTPAMAFELGLAAGPQRRAAALTAFGHAAQNGVAEALLGMAACHLWAGEFDEGLAQMERFFQANVLWREGAERVFEPVLRALFLSGHNIPAPLRRKVFEYAFVAFRHGALFAVGSPQSHVTELRTWFMSGLPAAFQPQVSVATTLWMGLGTVLAIALSLAVALGAVTPALLPLLLPYAVGMFKAVRASRARKCARRQFQAAWSAGER